MKICDIISTFVLFLTSEISGCLICEISVCWFNIIGLLALLYHTVNDILLEVPKILLQEKSTSSYVRNSNVAFANC